MSHTKVFAVADPSTFDGNPYEVAGRSIRQAAGLVKMANAALQASDAMTLNAEMERQLDTVGACDAVRASEARFMQIIEATKEDLANIERRLEAAAKAAEFNPKARV